MRRPATRRVSTSQDFARRFRVFAYLVGAGKVGELGLECSVVAAAAAAAASEQVIIVFVKVGILDCRKLVGIGAKNSLLPLQKVARRGCVGCVPSIGLGWTEGSG